MQIFCCCCFHPGIIIRFIKISRAQTYYKERALVFFHRLRRRFFCFFGAVATAARDRASVYVLCGCVCQFVGIEKQTRGVKWQKETSISITDATYVHVHLLCVNFSSSIFQRKKSSNNKIIMYHYKMYKSRSLIQNGMQ